MAFEYCSPAHRINLAVFDRIFDGIISYLERNKRKFVLDVQVVSQSSAERGGNKLKGFKDFPTGNGSDQGQNLAVTVL